MHSAYPGIASHDSASPARSPESLQRQAIRTITVLISCAVIGVVTRGGIASGETHAELFVISNPGIQISQAEIREAFTGTRQFVGTTKLVPVDNASAQASFLSNAIGMPAARYSVIWTRKSYREGMLPPIVKPDDDDVIDFVRKTPGAIGYVRLEPAGVNIVRRF